MNELATIDQKTQMPALATPKGAGDLVPRTTEDALRYAELVCTANLAPASYRGRNDAETAQRVALGILKGAEVGLPPLTALANIAIINGRPCLHSDGAIALAHASGRLEYISERLEGDGDNRMAVCEVKRRDQTKAVKRTFSVADAKRAKLWGNAQRQPWVMYPQRMLAARARSWALRDAFADVLSGLGIKEEIEDIAPPPEQQIADTSFLDDEPGEMPEAGPSVTEDAGEAAEPEPKKRGTEQQAMKFMTQAAAALGDMELREDLDAWTRSKASIIADIKADWPEIGEQLQGLIDERKSALPEIAA